MNQRTKPITSKTLAAMGVCGVLAITGCSSSKGDAHSATLKTALDQSSLSLKDAITKAEVQERLGSAKAQLITSGTSRFKIYLTGANAASKEVDIDIATGNVITTATSTLSASTANCAGPTTTKDALTIAEQASGGRAVGVQSDDDDACLFEVQALNGSTIWEVKIDRNGKVLEKEDVTNEVEDGEEAD